MSSTRYAVRIDGTDDYLFDLRAGAGPGGSIAIYCLRHPTTPHDDGVGTSHLYSDGRVCILSGCEPHTLDKAKAIAGFFAHGFSHYVRTGTFPNRGGHVNV